MMKKKDENGVDKQEELTKEEQELQDKEKRETIYLLVGIILIAIIMAIISYRNTEILHMTRRLITTPMPNPVFRFL